jgi:hypothetical protein
MRSRYLTCALAVVVLGLVNVASADLAVYDPFDGTTLDTSKWALSFGTATVAGSTVTLSDASAASRILSTAAWGVDSSIEFEMGAAPSGSGTMLVGTYEQSPAFANSAVHIRNDFYGTGQFAMEAWNSSQQYDGVPFTLEAGDVLRLDILSTGVNLYRNGSLIDSETSVIAWGVHEMAAYAAAGCSLQINRVSAGAVPEPGTVVLSLTGLVGLLAYAWRKRR